jgi:TolA-binding protein
MTGRASARPQAARGSRLANAAARALSLISATGIATALWTGVVGWPFAAAPARPSAKPAVPTPPARPHNKPRERTVVESPTPAAALEAAPASEAATPLPPPADATAARHRATPADSRSQAAALFHDANRARRDGDHRRARRLYARLIETHPGSDEAGLARVSLGRLLLNAGDARAAERQFRMYLAVGGQLSEEALVGQAQSSGQLRHTADEQQAWRRLLAGYPNSVYAAQARQRLAAIDAEPHEGKP